MKMKTSASTAASSYEEYLTIEFLLTGVARPTSTSPDESSTKIEKGPSLALDGTVGDSGSKHLEVSAKTVENANPKTSLQETFGIIPLDAIKERSFKVRHVLLNLRAVIVIGEADSDKSLAEFELLFDVATQTICVVYDRMNIVARQVPNTEKFIFWNAKYNQARNLLLDELQITPLQRLDENEAGKDSESNQKLIVSKLRLKLFFQFEAGKSHVDHGICQGCGSVAQSGEIFSCCSACRCGIYCSEECQSRVYEYCHKALCETYAFAGRRTNKDIATLYRENLLRNGRGEKFNFSFSSSSPVD